MDSMVVVFWNQTTERDWNEALIFSVP